MPNENFNALVDRAMRDQNFENQRTVVEKELLHYDILFALDKERLLDKLVFQGGTSLRLCYGGQRLSEDLDFAGGLAFKPTDLHEMKGCIESYLGSRYGLEVFVKEPKDLLHEDDRQGINVDKWQIRIITAPQRPDIPKQMIKLEVACIPAYSVLTKPLLSNYDFLPDGYTDTLILVESLDEIMADKLIAFPSCQRYIRYRDLWDLQWLIKQGAKINLDYVVKKVRDYQIDDYKQKLNMAIDRLPAIIHGADFKSQMSRFIPLSAQENTLKREKFYNYLEAEILGILSYCYEHVDI